MIIGLTGPVGSGKTEASRVFKRLGAYLIDADRIGHELFAPQSTVWHELVREFGSVILGPGGKVNRKRLGEIVFSDKTKLERLNEITHPLIKQGITRDIENARSWGTKLIVIEAALPNLFSGLTDTVWVIMAKREIRVRRLVRTGMKKEEIGRMMRSQMPQDMYLKLANVLIENNGKKQKLNAEIRANLKL